MHDQHSHAQTIQAIHNWFDKFISKYNVNTIFIMLIALLS